MIEPLKDGDIVVIPSGSKLEVGIHFNNRVLTLNNGRININRLSDILVINPTPKIQEVVDKIKILYKNELDGNKEKEITVNDFELGTVLETKSGKQWLVMGECWRLAHYTQYKDKTGRMFINMEHINKKLSLRENMDNLISQCNTLDDMKKYFKFSIPKAIKVDKSFRYTEDDIADFLHKGLIGLIVDAKHFCFILNTFYSKNYNPYNKIESLSVVNAGVGISRVWISTFRYNETTKIDRTIKIN